MRTIGMISPLYAAAGAAAGGAAPKTPAPETPKKAKPVFTVLEITAAVPLPADINRRTNEKFPFEKLDIGQSFGFIGRTAADLSSTVSSANKRARLNPIKVPGGIDANTGQMIPETLLMKAFAAYDVAKPDEDPHKATVRVFRLTNVPHKAPAPKKAKA